MGCCFGTQENEGGLPSERDRLIPDQHKPRITEPGLSPGTNAYFGDHGASRPREEVNKVQQILSDTANSVIDVAALESQGRANSESVSKTRMYRERLSRELKDRPLRLSSGCPPGVTNIQAELGAATVISPEDVQLMDRILRDVTGALQTIQVENRGALVDRNPFCSEI